ncbi:mucin-5AC [Girardinichthys multiradiatus]|uniref:mucin-5AC n=1 Tax=Girardinichthys multiradiatus TaxID=208333 RepID=UPI001FAC3972|nr:mucin-5AC [Girardinichthys multiradiatus]
MQSAPQVGNRAVSVSSSSIMASIIFIKDTGILCLLLSGLLLPSVLVSGQNTTADMNTTSPTTASATVTTASNTSMTQFPDMNTTLAASSSAVTPTESTYSTAYGGSNTSTTSDSSMNMMYCPSFSCYYSECYTMYNSKNASACVSGQSCQLLRSMDMWYNVSCSAFCAERCTNMSQTNCSVNCCNSTGCLNGSFASMMMTTTVAATTTTKAPTTTSTTVNNGNKCYKGTCTGETCYKDFKSQTLETCSSTQPHCQLRKETAEFFWTAGCSNCTGHTACKDTTKTPCNLECCTATTTSCLMLNGTLNVPSFATRGPYLHTELIASLLCLLAITLLL